MYEYAGTVDVPSKARDPIAFATLSRFNEAVRWQSQEMIGDCSVKEALRRCYEQFNGILPCEDQEAVDELGVDVQVNLTAMKSGIVQSFLLETLIQGEALPWTIQPTPIPTLSDHGRYQVLEQVQDRIFNQGFDGDLEQLIRDLKLASMRQEFEQAAEAAENMERLMTDQCLEGGWNEAMYGFITDFTVYPYAVLQGPVPVKRPQLSWSGNSLRTKNEAFYEFKSISPWDFWYSPDSPDTQRGTGVFVRTRWTRQNLLDAAKMNSYIQKNVQHVLTMTNKPNYNYRWLAENPDQHDNSAMTWTHCGATIDVLTHYGFFSGRELRDYGVGDVEDDEFYNATVTVVGDTTIQVVIPPNPNIQQRPIYTASFYKTHDRIANFSIPQRIRGVERCYMAALRYLMSNAASSSGPIVEADLDRLSKYMTEEDLGHLIPNVMYLAESPFGNQGPAMRFNMVPNNSSAYANLMQMFMDLADRVSNIPAALHGTAQGSGANRTFRGAAMLQGNAVKAISSSVMNIDQTVFAPIGRHLFNYNMVYEKDDSIKGDCKVLAQGSTGLLQKEINRQNAYEVLQLTGAAGNQLAALPNGAAIFAWALNNVLGQMGVPKELLLTDNQISSSISQPQAPVGEDVMIADAVDEQAVAPIGGI